MIDYKNGGKWELYDWSFPGRARCVDASCETHPKNGCFVGVWEFQEFNAARAGRPAGTYPQVIHKMVKLREFGSFCDNLPQIEVLEWPFV